MIEDVPCDAACGIAWRPAREGGARLRCRGAKAGQDRVAKRGHAGPVGSVRLLQTHAKFGRVCTFGAEDVINNLISVSTATPRPFSQRGRRGGDYHIEEFPSRGDQRVDAFDLLRRESLSVARDLPVRSTEIRGRRAL